MPVTVVPIALAHAASFHACLDAVAREKRYLAQVEAPPLARIEAFVSESVANDAAQFVALDGERVVGWADIFPAWAHAVAHCGSLGMGVLPAYRGQGIGERLLRACVAKAQAKGIRRIELEARADNAAAIGLYEKLGFVHEARKRGAMCFDGVDFDAVQMSLVQAREGVAAAATDVTLVPLAPAMFDAFSAAAIASFAGDLRTERGWSADQAGARATADFARLLPQGLATPGHTVFAIVAANESVGHLWFAVVDHGQRKAGYVYDLMVAPAFRRRGYAAAAMRAVEAHARGLGIAALRLHTFGHNHAAQALYRLLGFDVASVVMQKALDR